MRSQSHRAMAFAAVLFILGGCASVQVSQDYDPQFVAGQKQTWQWEQASQPATGDLRVDNPLLNSRIRRAIENHLAGRRFEQVPDRPDLFVSYHLAIQAKLQSHSSYSTFGMAYDYPWAWGYDADTHIYQYDECELTIDIKAADSNALVWRGTGVYRLKTHKTPEAAAEDMQHIVDKILSQFPPAGR